MKISSGDKTSVYDYHGFFKQGIIFQLTLRCPLSCAHCIVESGPHRKEEVKTEQAVKWLEAIGRYGKVKMVALTGGEPFLNRERLRPLLTVARRYALKIDIVTSCSWATSLDRAVQVLRDLPPITNLSLSADKYHLRFVPLTQVKHAAQAALSLGIGVGAFICLESEEDDFLALFREVLGEELYAQIRVLARYVHLAGRAAWSAEIASKVKRVPLPQLTSEGCAAAAVPVILPDGRVMACCGDTMSDPQNWPALTIGHLDRDPIDTIFERTDHNCLVHALRLLGPKELALIATERLGGRTFGRLYEQRNICDICRDVSTNPQVVSYLREYLEQPEVKTDLALGRWLAFGEPSPTLTSHEAAIQRHE
jgi:hypothetical protein